MQAKFDAVTSALHFPSLKKRGRGDLLLRSIDPRIDESLDLLLQIEAAQTESDESLCPGKHPPFEKGGQGGFASTLYRSAYR